MLKHFFCRLTSVFFSNLLLPDETSSERERVKYLVNIFEGNFVLKRDYILQVSFGSFRVSALGCSPRIKNINFNNF